MPAATTTIAAPSFTLSAVPISGTLISSVMSNAGRPGGNRTPNLRFWRPPLCQLSYWPTFTGENRPGDFREPYNISPRGRERPGPALHCQRRSAPPKNLSLENFRHYAGADGSAAFADRKAQPLFHRYRADQLHVHLDVVPGHDHLHPGRQLDRPGRIGRAEVKLRPIPLEEGRMPAPLLLGQHVHLTLKVRVRGDAAGLGQHLATLDLLALRPTKQHAHVVSRLSLIQKLPEHLHARAGGLLRGLQPHNLHLIVHLDDPALDAPGHHRAAPRDREHILPRHQKRLLDLALRHRNVLVHLLDQL